MAAFTPPIRRHLTAKGHYYKDANGLRVPGVTTLLDKGVPKKALVGWAANTTADHAVNNWEELSQKPVAARLKELQGARWAEKDKAAKRGTEVHHYAEKLLAGETVNVPDEIAGHVESCARFLDEFEFKAEHVEFSVASYKYGYAGTGDFIGTIRLPDSPRDIPGDWRDFIGRRIRILGDWKTNRSGIYGETALQLAGYRYADVMITGDTEQPMPQVDACAALHLRADGYSLVPVAAGQEIHRLLLYVQQVARLDDESRDFIGATIPPPTTSTYRLARQEPLQ
jgi:hypothetical protein